MLGIKSFDLWMGRLFRGRKMFFYVQN